MMTAPSTEVSRTAPLAAFRDARLVPYTVIALGGLLASLIGGEPALAALAVPFALAVAVGLRRTGPAIVSARIVLDADRVLEGDIVTGRIIVEWSADLAGDLMLHRLTGVTPLTAGPLAWPLPAGRTRTEVPIRLKASRWGRHTVAEVWVRLGAPLGLVSWTGKVVAGPTLRVLPGTERLNRLLDPSDSRAVWGAHRSRRLGDGHEFAELRPYQPGDRLRDLNWTATARHGRPFVNRHHPELSGDVVIALDAFTGGSDDAAGALSRAARAAWALASVHLRANDRVGLAGLGGSTQWLPPAGGLHARYQLMDALLRIGGEAAAGGAARAGARRPAVPTSALVIVLTPLHDPKTVEAITGWRSRGRSVAVVRIDTSDLLDEPASAAEMLAARVWRLELGRRESRITRLGIPVVTVTGDEPMTPVVSALRRARLAPSVRRALR